MARLLALYTPQAVPQNHGHPLPDVRSHRGAFDRATLATLQRRPAGNSIRSQPMISQPRAVAIRASTGTSMPLNPVINKHIE
jgi:hypothetical protein